MPPLAVEEDDGLIITRGGDGVISNHLDGISTGVRDLCL